MRYEIFSPENQNGQNSDENWSENWENLKDVLVSRQNSPQIAEKVCHMLCDVNAVVCVGDLDDE